MSERPHFVKQLKVIHFKQMEQHLNALLRIYHRVAILEYRTAGA